MRGSAAPPRGKDPRHEQAALPIVEGSCAAGGGGNGWVREGRAALPLGGKPGGAGGAPMGLSTHRSARMQPPCPHCDQPDMSLLRLVLIGEILRAEEPGLVWLAEVIQQSGLGHLAEEPMAPHRQPQPGTLHVLRHEDV